MFKVDAVCAFFISEGIAVGRPISQIKLQKLLYFAQGLFVAGTKGRSLLFEDSIYAWKYGPVVKTVYHEFKPFGNNAITEVEMDLILGEHYLNPLKELPDHIVQFLKKVWGIFSDYPPFTLVELTHLKGGPWDTALKKYSCSGFGDIQIDPEEMYKYFRKTYFRN